MDLVGGAARSLAATGGTSEVRGGTWGAGDVIVYAPTYAGSLMSISVSGGEPRPATKLPEDGSEGTHRLPSFLPNGRHFLFYAATGSGYEPGTICVGEIGSTEIRRLTSANSAAVFLPHGFLLFIKGRSLVAQSFDLERLELSGDPVALDGEWPRNLAISGYRSLTASAKAAVYQVNAPGATRLVWVDRTGRELGTAFEGVDAWYTSPRLSADGKRISVSAYSGDSQGDIWIIDPERNNEVLELFFLTDNVSNSQFPQSAILVIRCS